MNLEDQLRRWGEYPAGGQPSHREYQRRAQNCPSFSQFLQIGRGKGDFTESEESHLATCSICEKRRQTLPPDHPWYWTRPVEVEYTAPIKSWTSPVVGWAAALVLTVATLAYVLSTYPETPSTFQPLAAHHGLLECRPYSQNIASGAFAVKGIKTPPPAKIDGFTSLPPEKILCACGRETRIIPVYHHEKTGLDFVYIPGGAFYLRRPNLAPPYPLIQLNRYLMSRTEITRSQWSRIVEGKNVEDRRPQITSALGARKFCEKTGFRLPTEGQWEFAYRGGTSTVYYWGDKADPRYGWFGGSEVHPVASKKANLFGLYDMAGNVAEWCDEKEENGLVVRGGRAMDKGRNLTATARKVLDPNQKHRQVGFRVVFPLD